MSITDTHAHYIGVDAIERIRSEGESRGVRLVADGGVTRVEVGGQFSGLPLIPALSDVSSRLAWMDAAGVDVQFVAPWMDLAGYGLDEPSGQWLAEVQNVSSSGLVAAYPDRFRAVAAVPLQEPSAAARVLRHAVTELGHSAVQIGTHVGDVGLDDPGLDIFWDAVETLDVPVIVHPAELDVPRRVRRLFLHILVGNPSETTSAAAALLLGGVFERHPKLRVMLVHGGGFVPYQFGRIERGFTAAPPALRSRCAESPHHFLDRMYFDTVLHDDEALRYLVSFAGVERVVMGSDYPFPMRLDKPVEVIEALGLEQSDQDCILRAATFLRTKD